MRALFVTALLLTLAACSGSSSDDDTGAEPTPTPTATTPPASTATDTPAGPTPYADQPGPFTTRNETCSLVGTQVIASGEASVEAPTDAVLCAWAGTVDFPFYNYLCQPGLERSPALGEWVPYTIETGYVPADRGESSEAIDCVVCSAVPGEPATCYMNDN